MFFNGNGFYPQTTAAIGAWFVDRYFDQQQIMLTANHDPRACNAGKYVM